jgi:diaminopimelate decarboxylase
MLEEILLRTLCSQFQTPFFAYSANEIKKNCTEVLSITKGYDCLPCYALKANYNPSIIKIIQEMGFGADVVSGGELYFALKCGIPVDKIVFAGVGKTVQEIDKAVELGIYSLNIESDAELRVIEEIVQSKNKRINIAIRVNPDIDSKTHPYISTGMHENKFGVSKEKALALYERAITSPNIIPSGIHVHIGSQISLLEPYTQTTDFIEDLIQELANIGLEIKFVDLGGGIGIQYKEQLDSEKTQRTYIEKILPNFLKPFKNQNLKLIIELGRSIVGSAGLLITKVLYVKQTPIKKFVIVDAAMNNLIRPSLYQAYHQILPLTLESTKSESVDVVGPVCETSDYFAKDRKLPELKAGDFLAISACGAYGQVLSSNYNLRPSVPEYLISSDKLDTIFDGESIEAIASKYSW